MGFQIHFRLRLDGVLSFLPPFPLTAATYVLKLLANYVSVAVSFNFRLGQFLYCCIHLSAIKVAVKHQKVARFKAALP